ncbi:leucine-rich receptor-like protein kinase family protein [Striga asiatica]|uniref:Leucine-rich receptor-like protein kinase family protein n=1 Tax=Striga asiatica TaxID=4170 RepID=A0A5A7NWL8_STRAF|nr:leucine-rich receptor-like protein kinase family protein [Striga asiatica]
MRFFLLLLVCLCFVHSFGQLPSQDILALLEFKKGIKHDPTGYVLNSWNDESIDFNGCPSSWNGIMCNGGNVAAVVLDNLGLSADNADLSVFSNLTMLVKLSIANNSISGQLPRNLGEFKSLEYFDISNNLFYSSLPAEIGKMPGLKNLSLAGNNFSGSIPDEISGLASIRSLDMSRNSLSGPLPLSLTKLVNLVYLNLSLNGFNRSVLKGFELMTQLDVLDLHGNKLDGELDPEFFLLTSAGHIDFSGNFFVSSSSDKRHSFLVGLSPSVKHLNLSHNRLTGSLVGGGEAQEFGSLKVLDLSYNQLSGDLPSFSFVLRLGNNRFSGSVPNNLLKGDSLMLTELDLRPISIITSTTLHTLNLSSNMLSGEVPLLTGSCAVIDLSKNQFGGNLTRLLKWENVEFIDLSQNHMAGPIPEATSQIFLRLNYLNLSRNSLNGSLPKVTTLFPKLTTLDLSFNQLDGPISSALLTSSTLNELHLQNNLLSGSIDFSPLSNDSNLHVLDLSNNQFNSELPDGLGSFIELRVLNISGNKFFGSLPTSIGNNITTLYSLDICRNNFTGQLPVNLPNSLQSFNASYNDFSGVVPENLRKFPLSSFYPGNSHLQFPNPPPGSSRGTTSNSRKHLQTIIKVVIIIVSCLAALIILILLAIFFIRYKKISRQQKPLPQTNKNVTRQASANPSTLAGQGDDIIMTSRKGKSSETIISPEEKMGAITGFSPSKKSHFSWSPESGDSFTVESLSRSDVRSPESGDRLAGELYFLDDTVSFTAEELSRAPAEVLGRSSHGTSYKATLENGVFLTVKWLREGVAKQRKEFAKEAKKFSNIRHPNVVGLRGYYWGPTQHEKLILSDYISPGSLASFLYGPPLTWAQRLKIAVDIARGLNYLHFDRAIPHGNLKSTNILLDGPDLNARVADYCLHRLMTQLGTIEQILDAGVLGYRAPELVSSKKPQPSFKSDVYAFGVILLELLTGKCAGDVVSGSEGGVGLTDWVRLRVAEARGSECFDTALGHEMSVPLVDKGMKEVLGIALRCVRSRVGFIGLGNMGSRMANNLIKAGYNVVVHDVNHDVMAKFSEKGILTKNSPLEVAEASDAVITMLPSSNHVTDVYMGPKGMLNGEDLRSFLFIDSSTIDPQTSRKVSAAVSNTKEGGGNCRFMLDAPVSGGVLSAESGSLTFMVGGSEEAYRLAKPLFLSMGKNVIYCGGPGNGSTAKICNNLAMAVSMLGVSEAFALGQSLGITATTLTKIFNSSSARCWSRDYNGGFATKLMAKDLNLATASAKGVGAKTPMTFLADEIFSELCNEGLGAKDFSCVFRHYFSGKDEL